MLEAAYRRERVEIVLERRTAERRRADERRLRASDSRTQLERRTIRCGSGRRVGERRAGVVPTAAPRPLPPAAQRYAARLVFVERLELSEAARTDLEGVRLVTRFQAGDVGAFEELYRLYLSRIDAYLRLALRDEHEAEDAAQQVFMSVLNALPDYEVRDVPFRIWLFRIARNHVLNHLAKHRPVDVEDPDEINRRRNGSCAPSAELECFARLGEEAFLRSIAGLSLAQRQVLFLRYTLSLNAIEVAALLESSPNAVRNVQYRALKQLRTELAAPRGPDERTRHCYSMLALRAPHRVVRARRLALCARPIS